MGWTTPRTWSPGETVTAALMNQYVRDQQNVLATFSKGGPVWNPNGIDQAVDLEIWRALFDCKVIACRGKRVGGTTGTFSVNAKKNGTTKFCSPDISLPTAGVYVAGVLSTTATDLEMSAGDSLQMMIISVGDQLASQLTCQVEMNPR